MHIRKILTAVVLLFCCSTLYGQQRWKPPHPLHPHRRPAIPADSVFTRNTPYHEPKIWPQAVYGSLLGPACGFGVNYDVRFTKSRIGLGARAGIGFAPEYTDSWYNWKDGNRADTGRHRIFVNNRPSIFAGVNYILGQPDKHCLEAGAGLTYLFGDSLWFQEGVSDRTTLGWLSIGGRRHFSNKHFLFRIAAMAMFSTNRVTPNMDMGFGYCW